MIAGLALGQNRLPPADERYLRDLARDTWRCIAGLADEATGLPYDNSDRGEFTSVSNIGIYLSSVAAAEKLKIIDHSEAVARLKMTVTSLEKLKTWRGFQQSWNSVKTLEPATHDAAISILDTGNLAAGLIHVANAVPEVAARSRKLLKAMDWGWFYDRPKDALFGGYDTKTEVMNPNWHLSALGTDAELALFLAVAYGHAPASIWEKLDRSMEEKYGYCYLKPGWQGGGLFMQFISGLWLDNRGTALGDSARNFAAAQIEHGKRIGAPVWGWSACDNPAGGYLGWGALKDDVVTPHASALAISLFPVEVLANFRKFETLGVRSKDRGFFDSYDWRSKRSSRLFLVLDQGMLFLSLANFLEKDCIRAAFQKDPTVQRGRREIGMFREAMNIRPRADSGPSLDGFSPNQP